MQSILLSINISYFLTKQSVSQSNKPNFQQITPNFFVFRDTESIYEVMAVSIENLLCSSASGRRHCVTERRESYKELKYPSSDHENTCGGGSGGQWDSNTTNSSVQESVERNR